MLETIILLTAGATQQFALSELLRQHNPALSFRGALTLDDLAAVPPSELRNARLVAFTTAVIVPQRILDALGHGAYNFHPGPPHYPGWAPAHFALYDGARTFGATAHAMAARVDSGPIVGVEAFAVPGQVSVRELEQIAFVRLAYLFWRMARDIANEPGALPELPIAWSGVKSTRRMYQEICDIPPDIDAQELRRRIRAFDDDFRAIPLTVSLHGIRFRLAGADLGKAETPRVEAPPIAIAS
ncbi:MAG: formyltransferase family protein [Xanthobacteraceae bacterium]|nr:formyltransferase family protein [Xanthobacteraceae bacterium]